MKQIVNHSATVHVLRGRAVRSLLLALLLTLLGGMAVAQDMDEPIIQVGDETALTHSEFEQQFERAIRLMALRQGIPFNDETRAMFDQFREAYLTQLATQEALTREAEARGITVTDEEVQQQITQIQESFGGEEPFQQALDELGYEGVDTYRDDVREGLQTQRVIDEIRAGIEVSDEDVSTFYDENQEQFGEASLDDVRDQIRAHLVGVRLDQQFGDLREQYGIQTNPDVLQVEETEGAM